MIGPLTARWVGWEFSTIQSYRGLFAPHTPSVTCCRIRRMRMERLKGNFYVQLGQCNWSTGSTSSRQAPPKLTAHLLAKPRRAIHMSYGCCRHSRFKSSKVFFDYGWIRPCISLSLSLAKLRLGFISNVEDKWSVLTSLAMGAVIAVSRQYNLINNMHLYCYASWQMYISNWIFPSFHFSITLISGLLFSLPRLLISVARLFTMPWNLTFQGILFSLLQHININLHS